MKFHMLFVIFFLNFKYVYSSNFKIGLLAPMRDSFGGFSGMTSASAIDLAIEKIQSDPDLNLNNQINLTYVVRDSNCDSKTSAGFTADLLTNETVNAIIGPPCSSACRPAAELASFWNIPLISWAASDGDFNDKNLYSTLARTLGPFDKLGTFLIKVFKQYNWKNVAVIGCEDLIWIDADKAIRKVFLSGNITISYSSIYSGRPSISYIKNTLNSIKTKARIVILINPTEDRRKFMLEAHDEGMTNGEYVFYTLEMLPQDDIKNVRQSWQGNDGRDVEAKQAFESVFHVVLASKSSDEIANFRIEVAKRMREPPWNIDLLPGVTADPYAPFLYDAVLLYAIALGETIKAGEDPKNGEILFSNMKNKFFVGMTGNIILDKFADREPDYWIMDMNPVTGIFEKVAEILNTNDGHVEFRKSIIEPSWSNGLVGHKNAPRDVPICGFSNEFCKSELSTWIIIISTLGCITLIGSIIGIAIYTYRKSQFEADLLLYSWKIALDEVDFVKNLAGGASSVSLGSKSTKSNDSSEKSLGTSFSDSKASTSQGKSLISIGTGNQLFTDIGMYKSSVVALKHIKKEHMQLTRKIKDMLHDNLNVFVGACFEPPNIYLLWNYCKRGSLQDVLMNDDVKLDNNFKMSFMFDIARGMVYIHKCHLHSHGNLKSSNCLIDDRWAVRITDYGLPSFLSGQNFEAVSEYEMFKRKLWTAPEILRENFPPPKGTQKGDVFSFAIICVEILTRNEPYCFDKMTPRDVIHRIRNSESIPFRPKLTENNEFGKPIVALVNKMWADDPQNRPSFPHIQTALRKINKGDINIVDAILSMMDKYAINLENIVQERTAQIGEEKLKTERLLSRMLPSSVAENLKLGLCIKPENFDESTIYFSDIVGFTSLSSDSSPIQIVDFLNDLYSCFDEIIASHDAYKVETIGDAYMVVSGVPVRNGKRHCGEIADISLDLLSAVTQFEIRHRPKEKLRLRIGLHSGPVVAGVVGLIMPRYCLFGESVNMTARMESLGKPLRIHVSSEFYHMLSDMGGYKMISRSKEINIKGKGFIKTYWLYGKNGYTKPLPYFDKNESD